MRVEYGGILRCITSDGRNVNIAEELNRLENEKRINMSGECDFCGEQCVCKLRQKVKDPMLNYFKMVPGMTEEVKVWAQMFFNDGSVTQGQYIPRCIFDDKGCIEALARDFLQDTQRKEGVLFIWGAGRVYAKRAELLLARRGALKGSETLRLRNL